MITSIAALLLGQISDGLVADRVDMGLRLRRLDAAWVQADVAKKQQVMPIVNRGVMGFFSGQFGPVCQQLDEATAILEGRARRSGEGLIFRVTPQIYEPGEEVEVKIGWAYAEGSSLRVKWEGHEFEVPAGGQVSRKVKTTVRMMPMIFPPFHDSVRGTEDFVVDGVKFGSGTAWLVGAKSWAEKVEPAAAGKSLARQVHPQWDEISRQLVQGRSGGLEAPFYVADVAARADSVAPEGHKNLMPTLVRWENTVIRVSSGSVTLGSPKTFTKVLIALHGAGGNEHMFPESYGSGGFVRKAVEDGWLVLTPRATGSAVKDCRAWLASQGVEVKKLVIAGHSMGGGLALAAAADDVDAIVVFAPAGGRVPEGIPLFVGLGAGEMAMLKGSVESLGKRATEFKTYENAEHLMVVAEGTNDAWEFVMRVTKD